MKHILIALFFGATWPFKDIYVDFINNSGSVAALIPSIVTMLTYPFALGYLLGEWSTLKMKQDYER